MPISLDEDEGKEEEKKISLDNLNMQLYNSEIIKDKKTVKKVESLLPKFE